MASTNEVSQTLRCSAARLIYLVGRRRIPAPTKNRFGNYSWTRADIARAARALSKVRRGRPLTRGGANGLDGELDAILRGAIHRARELKDDGWAEWLEKALTTRERGGSEDLTNGKQPRRGVPVGG
jgi:hypothetical protein